MLSSGLISEAAELTALEEAPARKPQIWSNWQGDDRGRPLVQQWTTIRVGPSPKLNQAVQEQLLRNKKYSLQDYDCYEEVL